MKKRKARKTIKVLPDRGGNDASPGGKQQSTGLLHLKWFESYL
jgi:hypothetical protein